MKTSADTIPFNRNDLARHPERIRVLNKGNFANAYVMRYEAPDGQSWVIKDFSRCPAILRATIGRFMAWRETAALRRLAGRPGIPGDGFRLDRYAVGMRFLHGTVLCDATPGALSAAFFRKLEHMVWGMHRRGIAHLDLRYRRNIMLLEDGTPGVIDFQSYVMLARFPRRIQRFLRALDYSGLYKHWNRYAPGTMPASRCRLLSAINRFRVFWVVKGYGLKIQNRYVTSQNQKPV